VGGERAVEPVERARDDGDLRLRDAVRAQLLLRQIDQRRELGRHPVEARDRLERVECAGQGRQQHRVRVSGREVADAGRDLGDGCDRERRPFADASAAPACRRDDAAAPQLAVGGGDRHRADAELGGEAADGGQLLARRELALADPPLDAARDLARAPHGGI
jgi:hypothetical protein